MSTKAKSSNAGMQAKVLTKAEREALRMPAWSRGECQAIIAQATNPSAFTPTFRETVSCVQNDFANIAEQITQLDDLTMVDDATLTRMTKQIQNVLESYDSITLAPEQVDRFAKVAALGKVRSLDYSAGDLDEQKGKGEPSELQGALITTAAFALWVADLPVLLQRNLSGWDLAAAWTAVIPVAGQVTGAVAEGLKRDWPGVAEQVELLGLFVAAQFVPGVDVVVDSVFVVDLGAQVLLLLLGTGDDPFADPVKQRDLIWHRITDSVTRSYLKMTLPVMARIALLSKRTTEQCIESTVQTLLYELLLHLLGRAPQKSELQALQEVPSKDEPHRKLSIFRDWLDKQTDGVSATFDDLDADLPLQKLAKQVDEAHRNNKRKHYENSADRVEKTVTAIEKARDKVAAAAKKDLDYIISKSSETILPCLIDSQPTVDQKFQEHLKLLMFGKEGEVSGIIDCLKNKLDSRRVEEFCYAWGKINTLPDTLKLERITARVKRIVGDPISRYGPDSKISSLVDAFPWWPPQLRDKGIDAAFPVPAGAGGEGMPDSFVVISAGKFFQINNDIQSWLPVPAPRLSSPSNDGDRDLTDKITAAIGDGDDIIFYAKGWMWRCTPSWLHPKVMQRPYLDSWSIASPFLFDITKFSSLDWQPKEETTSQKIEDSANGWPSGLRWIATGAAGAVRLGETISKDVKNAAERLVGPLLQPSQQEDPTPQENLSTEFTDQVSFGRFTHETDAATEIPNFVPNNHKAFSPLCFDPESGRGWHLFSNGNLVDVWYKGDSQNNLNGIAKYYQVPKEWTALAGTRFEEWVDAALPVGPNALILFHANAVTRYNIADNSLKPLEFVPLKTDKTEIMTLAEVFPWLPPTILSGVDAGFDLGDTHVLIKGNTFYHIDFKQQAWQVLTVPPDLLRPTPATSSAAPELYATACARNQLGVYKGSLYQRWYVTYHATTNAVTFIQPNPEQVLQQVSLQRAKNGFATGVQCAGAIDDRIVWFRNSDILLRSGVSHDYVLAEDPYIDGYNSLAPLRVATVWPTLANTPFEHNRDAVLSVPAKNRKRENLFIRGNLCVTAADAFSMRPHFDLQVGDTQVNSE